MVYGQNTLTAMSLSVINNVRSWPIRGVAAAVGSPFAHHPDAVDYTR